MIEHGFTGKHRTDAQRETGYQQRDAALVARTLKSREFLVDYRPRVGIRVSPHFYNTLDEIDAIVAEMASIVHKRDYDTSTKRSLVTSEKRGIRNELGHAGRVEDHFLDCEVSEALDIPLWWLRRWWTGVPAKDLLPIMSAAGFHAVKHVRSWFLDPTGEIVFRKRKDE